MANLLPPELWAYIFSFLSYNDIMNVARINKKLNLLTTGDQQLWQRLFLQHHGPQKFKLYKRKVSSGTSWKDATTTEMLKSHLAIKNGTIYKRDTEFGISRWVNRSFSLSKKYITYSLPDPLKGIYVSKKLRSTERKMIHLRNITLVEPKGIVVHNNIIFYCFDVREKVLGLKRLANTHSFATTNANSAQKWQKDIRNRVLAYKCWKSQKKRISKRPDHRGLLRRGASFCL